MDIVDQATKRVKCYFVYCQLTMWGVVSTSPKLHDLQSTSGFLSGNFALYSVSLYHLSADFALYSAGLYLAPSEVHTSAYWKVVCVSWWSVLQFIFFLTDCCSVWIWLVDNEQWNCELTGDRADVWEECKENQSYVEKCTWHIKKGVQQEN